jgi:hypothetical protein
MTVPRRYWGSSEQLPTPAEAMDLPLRSFPNWILRITCERCFKDRMLSEASAPPRQRDMPLGILLARARHDGCGGGAGRAELLTGIEGASSRPVRRIVLRAG